MEKYLFIILLLLLIFIILIFINNKKMKYNKKIMKNSTRIRFEYLDTFYYQYMHCIGDDTVYVIFHIVKDVDTNNIYAIPESSFINATHQVLMNNFKVLKGKSIFKSKEIQFGDNGYLWIDKEYNDIYHHDDEMIKLGKKVVYSKNKKTNKLKSINVEPYYLFNLNSKYDVSLLDKATFVYGVAKFDVDK